jgi:hypothetical protein
MKLSIGTQTAIHHFLIAGVAAAVPVAVVLLDPTPLGLLLGGLLGAGSSAFLYAKIPSAREIAERDEAEGLRARAIELEREVRYLKSPAAAVKAASEAQRAWAYGPPGGSREFPFGGPGGR